MTVFTTEHVNLSSKGFASAVIDSFFNNKRKNYQLAFLFLFKEKVEKK